VGAAAGSIVATTTTLFDLQQQHDGERYYY
jgi:hypothetical protein